MICEDDIYFTEYFDYDSLLQIKEFLEENNDRTSFSGLTEK